MGLDNEHPLRQEFELEEFKQLHEHIRNFETTVGAICIGSLTACTALLTAITGWLYGGQRGPLTVLQCYLFLSPALLAVLVLLLISSYKSAIYRNGYYLKVFFEETGSGADWHIHLVNFRKIKTSLIEKILGEHGDPAALMFWPWFAISIGLYFGGLWSIPQAHKWMHFLAPGVLMLLMIVAHIELVSNRKSIEDAWHEVQRRMSAARTTERAYGAPA